MQDLRKGMRILADDIDRLAIDFRRALLNKSLPPKQVLLELQQRLDQLRQKLWDTRKLCDPFLVVPRREIETSDGSLAERVVRYIDEHRSQQQPLRRRSG